MKLYIRQKVFSFRDQFTVKDRDGHTRYTVKGELISLGKRLHIYDKKGKELGLVRQKLVALLPHFIVEIGGKHRADIVKKFTLLKPEYRVDGLGWRVTGNILAHDYEIHDGNQRIAAIHKVWMAWGDSFELDIDDNADELTAVAVVLAIDAVLDAEADAAASAASSGN